MMALLSRNPSITSSTFCPVRPRTMGEPPAWLVFCTDTPGRYASASAVVRGLWRASASASTTDTARRAATLSSGALSSTISMISPAAAPSSAATVSVSVSSGSVPPA
jgi:hypothetical protein